MRYLLVKYNNEFSHNLDDYDTREEAEYMKKALTHPDWPYWQGIKIIEIDENPNNKTN